MKPTMLQVAACRFQERLQRYTQEQYGLTLDHGLESVAYAQELLAPLCSLNSFEPEFQDDLQLLMDAGAYLSMLLTEAWKQMGLNPIDVEDGVEDILELRLCRSAFLAKHPEFNLTITVYPIMVELQPGVRYIQIPGLDLLDLLLNPFNPMPYFAETMMPLKSYFQVIETYFLSALIVNSPYAIGEWRRYQPEIQEPTLSKALAWIRTQYRHRLHPLSNEQKALVGNMIEAASWPPLEYPGNEKGEANLIKLEKIVAGRNQDDVGTAIEMFRNSSRRCLRLFAQKLNKAS